MYRLGEKNRKIRDMFSAIAGRYDFLNRLLSFGQDGRWRREAVSRVEKRSGGLHLDLACGTADMGLEVVRQIPDAEVVGGDISLEMLREAKRKAGKIHPSRKFRFVAFAGESIPFRDGVFDSILIAFGIRNVVERERALQEMARVLKKEGVLIILEFSLPRRALLRKVYLLYFQGILPRLAGIFSDREAYEYLSESVLDFPDTGQFMQLMEVSGFSAVSAKHLTFGIVTIYTGRAG